MAEYQEQIDTLHAEAEIIAAYMQTIRKKGTEYQAQNKLLSDRQFRRDSLKQKLELAQREKRDKFFAARKALYALDDANEPHISNTAPLHTLYTREAAIQSLLKNESDFILAPNGLTPEEIAQLSADPAIHFVSNKNNDIRFLIFNPNLDDIALRRAISCLIDPEYMAEDRLEGRVSPALGWVAPEKIGWHSSIILPPCHGLDADSRFEAGKRILQKAGYVWDQAPSPNQVGSGLHLPSGEKFPSLTLFAPQEDSSRTEAASYIAEAAQKLGIPLELKIIPAEDLFFVVYGTGDYDLAIVGWRLSLYPDYLCDFFADGNPYGYENSAIDEKCIEFSKTSNLAKAREELFEIEVLLWDDLPALPLFSSKITEAYRNFSLPFENYLGGFAPTLYGVPDILE